MPKNNQGGEGDLESASQARGTIARGNAANLSREARIKGGQRSAQVQTRDQHGQFAGRAESSPGRTQRRDEGMDRDTAPGR